jgi:aminoglycoside phosphotransferase (APT) family kinase protein
MTGRREIDHSDSLGPVTEPAGGPPADPGGPPADPGGRPAEPAGKPVEAPPGMPPSEVDIDEGLVRTLLRAQHPDLADRSLKLVAVGWDNATYRLGADLAVRVPRIAPAVDLIRNEQRWLPKLAPDLPVPVPVPVRVGVPGAAFPWPWSVVPWIPGVSAEHESLSPDEAGAFGRFLAAVHRPAPPDAPRNDYRGVPLHTRTETVRDNIARIAAADLDGVVAPDTATLSRWWDAAVSVPIDVPETWIHADLHPKNVIVDGGRLAAVVDWGDLTVGDRASDLAGAWMLFPPAVHAQIWASYGPISAQTMLRGAGWALFFGATTLAVGLAGDPAFVEIGAKTLQRLSEAAPFPP